VAAVADAAAADSAAVVAADAVDDANRAGNETSSSKEKGKSSNGALVRLTSALCFSRILPSNFFLPTCH
jgi:hypothetical protein